MKNRIAKALARLVRHYIPTRPDRAVSPSSEPGDEVRGASVDSILAILSEAWGGNSTRLFALYRDIMSDAHLQSAVSTRKLAILGDVMRILPFDRGSADDRAASELLENAWADLSGKREALTHLLDSSLYPVSVVRKSFRASRVAGLRFEVAALDPVEYRRIDLSNPDGRLRLFDVSPEGHVLGTSKLPDPRRYIVHRGHLMTSVPDRWGGPMRAAVFWWLFKTQGRAFWARFLERFGAPFIVGKYDRGQEGAQGELAYAFREATRIFGLVIPNDSDVNLVQSNAGSSTDAFERFHKIASGELAKLILGQTMTMDAQTAGLGGQQAAVMENVRGDIRAFDQSALAETLRDQLFRQFCAINGLAGRAPIATWGEDADESGEVATLLKDLKLAGLEPADSALPGIAQRLGFELTRSAAAGGGGGVAALAASGSVRSDRPEVDRVIRAASAPLARAFRGTFAPVGLAVAEASDPADLEERLRALYGGGLDTARLQSLIEEALTAFAANGAASP